MPLILMQHSPEYTKYDDQIGEQYHYPSQYFDRIVEGEQFIYRYWSLRIKAGQHETFATYWTRTTRRIDRLSQE